MSEFNNNRIRSGTAQQPSVTTPGTAATRFTVTRPVSNSIANTNNPATNNNTNTKSPATPASNTNNNKSVSFASATVINTSTPALLDDDLLDNDNSDDEFNNNIKSPSVSGSAANSNNRSRSHTVIPFHNKNKNNITQQQSQSQSTHSPLLSTGSIELNRFRSQTTAPITIKSPLINNTNTNNATASRTDLLSTIRNLSNLLSVAYSVIEQKSGDTRLAAEYGAQAIEENELLNNQLQSLTEEYEQYKLSTIAANTDYSTLQNKYNELLLVNKELLIEELKQSDNNNNSNNDPILLSSSIAEFLRIELNNTASITGNIEIDFSTFIRQYNSDKSKLNSRLKYSQSTIESLETELQRCNNEKLSQSKSINELLVLKSELQSQLKDSNNKYNNLQLESKTLLNNKLSENQLLINKLLSQSETELLARKVDNDSLTKLNEKLTNEIQSLKLSLSGLNSIETEKSAVLKYSQSQSDEISALNKLLLQSKSEYNELKLEFEQYQHSTRLALEQLEKANKSNNKSISMADELNELTDSTELSSLREQLDSMRSNRLRSDRTIELLESEINQLKSNNLSQSASTELTLKSHLNSIQSELESIRVELLKSQSTVNELESDNLLLKQQLAAKINELTIEKSKSTEKSTITNTITELWNVRDELKQQLTDREKLILSLTNQLNQLKIQSPALIQQKQSEINELNQSNSLLQSELDRINQLLFDNQLRSKQQLIDFNNENRLLITENQLLQTQRNQSELLNSQLKSRIELLELDQNNSQGLKEKELKLINKINSLQTELQTVNTDNNNKLNEILLLKQQLLTVTESHSNELTALKEKYSIDSTSNKAEIGLLNQQLIQSKLEIDRLKSELESANTANNNINTTTDSELLSQLKSKYSIKCRTNLALDNELTAIKAELSVNKQLLSQYQSQLNNNQHQQSSQRMQQRKAIKELIDNESHRWAEEKLKLKNQIKTLKQQLNEALSASTAAAAASIPAAPKSPSIVPTRTDSTASNNPNLSPSSNPGSPKATRFHVKPKAKPIDTVTAAATAAATNNTESISSSRDRSVSALTEFQGSETWKELDPNSDRSKAAQRFQLGQGGGARTRSPSPLSLNNREIVLARLPDLNSILPNPLILDRPKFLLTPVDEFTLYQAYLQLIRQWRVTLSVISSNPNCNPPVPIDPHWPLCCSCYEKFSFLNRKRSCALCGGVYCKICASERVTIEKFGLESVRACNACSTTGRIVASSYVHFLCPPVLQAEMMKVSPMTKQQQLQLQSKS